MRRYFLILSVVFCLLFALHASADGLRLTRDALSVDGCYAYMLEVRNTDDIPAENIYISDSGIEGCEGAFIWSGSSDVAKTAEGRAYIPELSPAGQDGDSVYLRYECPVSADITQAETVTTASVTADDARTLYSVAGAIPVAASGSKPAADTLPANAPEEANAYSCTWISENDGIRVSVSLPSVLLSGHTYTAEAAVRITGNEELSKIQLTGTGIEWLDSAKGTIDFGKGTNGSVYSTSFRFVAPEISEKLKLDFSVSASAGVLSRSGNLTVSPEIRSSAKLKSRITVEDWSWSKGTKHTLTVKLHNSGPADLTDITVSAADFLCGDRDIGQAIFIKQDNKKIKTKLQQSSYTFDSLPAGSTTELTLQWTPEVNTASLDNVAVSLTVSANASGIQENVVFNTSIQRDSGKVSNPFDLPIKGKLSVGLLLSVIAGISAILLILAAILSAKQRRKEKKISGRGV